MQCFVSEEEHRNEHISEKFEISAFIIAPTMENNVGSDRVLAFLRSGDRFSILLFCDTKGIAATQKLISDISIESSTATKAYCENLNQESSSEANKIPTYEFEISSTVDSITCYKLQENVWKWKLVWSTTTTPVLLLAVINKNNMPEFDTNVRKNTFKVVITTTSSNPENEACYFPYSSECDILIVSRNQFNLINHQKVNTSFTREQGYLRHALKNNVLMLGCEKKLKMLKIEEKKRLNKLKLKYLKLERYKQMIKHRDDEFKAEYMKRKVSVYENLFKKLSQFRQLKLLESFENKKNILEIYKRTNENIFEKNTELFKLNSEFSLWKLNQDMNNIMELKDQAIMESSHAMNEDNTLNSQKMSFLKYRYETQKSLETARTNFNHKKALYDLEIANFEARYIKPENITCFEQMFSEERHIDSNSESEECDSLDTLENSLRGYKNVIHEEEEITRTDDVQDMDLRLNYSTQPIGAGGIRSFSRERIKSCFLKYGYPIAAQELGHLNGEELCSLSEVEILRKLGPEEGNKVVRIIKTPFQSSYVEIYVAFQDESHLVSDLSYVIYCLYKSTKEELMLRISEHVKMDASKINQVFLHVKDETFLEVSNRNMSLLNKSSYYIMTKHKSKVHNNEFDFKLYLTKNS